MAHTIEHSIVVDAAPEEVWAVLTDSPSYERWNPFITSLTGDLRQGARLEVVIVAPGQRPRTFRPTVLEVRPARELRWLGRFIVRGLFDGEHAFEIEPLGNGRSRLTQSERFTGVLVRPLRSLLTATETGFEQMDQALKVEAERRSIGARPRMG